MTSPENFDRWWLDLLALSRTRGMEDRWPAEEKLLALAGDRQGADLADLTNMITAVSQNRLRQMCDNDQSNERLWLISGLVHQQMILPDDYGREDLYRLLHIVDSGSTAAVTEADVVALVDLVWALKLPKDPEPTRQHTINTWLTTTNHPNPTPHTITTTLLTTITNACPPNWQHITGTLTITAGQLLTDLTVTTPDHPTGATLNQLFPAPETITWRGPNPTWWRLTLDLTPTSHTLQPHPDEHTPPPPTQLLRLSDYNAEQPTHTPPWLHTYATTGTIDYGHGPRTVLGPAEALHIARSTAITRNTGPHYDTTKLTTTRLPVGYRVYMYQPPDTPFHELILDTPVLYIGDDTRIYPTHARNPHHANEEFRTTYQQRHGYDTTTGQPWPTTPPPRSFATCDSLRGVSPRDSGRR